MYAGRVTKAVILKIVKLCLEKVNRIIWVFFRAKLRVGKFFYALYFYNQQYSKRKIVREHMRHMLAVCRDKGWMVVLYLNLFYVDGWLSCNYSWLLIDEGFHSLVQTPKMIYLNHLCPVFFPSPFLFFQTLFGVVSQTNVSHTNVWGTLSA